jgi:hypothetical protein
MGIGILVVVHIWMTNWRRANILLMMKWRRAQIPASIVIAGIIVTRRWWWNIMVSMICSIHIVVVDSMWRMGIVIVVEGASDSRNILLVEWRAWAYFMFAVGKQTLCAIFANAIDDE